MDFNQTYLKLIEIRKRHAIDDGEDIKRNDYISESKNHEIQREIKSNSEKQAVKHEKWLEKLRKNYEKEKAKREKKSQFERYLSALKK